MRTESHLVSCRVALLVETSTKVGRDLLEGIRDYSREQESWNLELQPGGANQVLPDQKTWKGTGIISKAANPSLVQAILKTKLPTVFVTMTDRQRKTITRSDILEVLVDADAVAQLAANHLLERGLRHFAFVGNSHDPNWSRRRQLAFEERLARESIEVEIYPPDSRLGKNPSLETRRLMNWLKKLPKPVGIMAANDARGLQVLNACRESDLLVPDQVCVIGVDNDELICTVCHPPLSSIAMTTRDAGYRGAQALHTLMSEGKVATRQIFIEAAQVISRESTATAVAQDWRVEKSRKFILQKASEMIQVSDVVNHVGISRRSLEVYFTRAVGHSLLKEIHHRRIERAKGLLLSNAGTMNNIARMSGFSNANYMCKAFKKAVGVSPQKYPAYIQKLNK